MRTFSANSPPARCGAARATAKQHPHERRNRLEDDAMACEQTHADRFHCYQVIEDLETARTLLDAFLLNDNDGLKLADVRRLAYLSVE
jgi:hypothetical protein